MNIKRNSTSLKIDLYIIKYINYENSHIIGFLFSLSSYNLFEDVFDDLVIDSGALKESFVFEIIFLFPN